MTGWTCSYRSMWDHPHFSGDAERAGVWLWLIHHAAWKQTRFKVNGSLITLERGQVCFSYRQVSEATGMSIRRLRGFLNDMENDTAVTRDVSHGRTILTICNYDKYQDKKDSGVTVKVKPRAQQTTREGHTKEQGNNSVSKDTGENASVDLVKVIFDEGLKVLLGSGHNERQARAIIGKWRKQSDDGAVVMAISNAVKQGVTDPVSYIQACLGNAKRRAEAPRMGSIRTNKNGEQEVFDGVNGWLVERW